MECDMCGETKWGDKFPETDSVCLCDEDNTPTIYGGGCPEYNEDDKSTEDKK